ncbi:hypothetical protein [uncultured Porphyromonas sp.]|uniref:hypothetical protein n=1 Tax=uncultured Porphyromonas sp. TaxID=159274 RepID=UPI002607120E|nr:hypothetical protein [uncultured Porphyromonas sp.]
MLNGKVYRQDGLPIPEIVLEAADRLIKAKGGRYFTIDATPQFVIEVNPGESRPTRRELGRALRLVVCRRLLY